ncbi:hypothetical protein IV203_017386 [Nitzschia inconspicua]|uniref:Uncharacterized protein n=1 Tax=Nitzschia inconspicua TaxID=303405 RepID=A0A9K3KS79_9STRA|nr:hypothetical protein IV203_017573 [Nitzschia inconspicua]KAG7348681.1 hypothetical protein IV203_017386 [Nitzschia inconspicua]
MAVANEASVFSGPNAFGMNLIGSVVESYDDAKENGCSTAPNDEAGVRPNNLPICPIASKKGLVYVTLAGGGLLVLNPSTTPMTIVGEYGNRIVYGAGCGGAVLSFDDTQYAVSRPQNTPMPIRVF